jgi:hypothetical protein
MHPKAPLQEISPVINDKGKHSSDFKMASALSLLIKGPVIHALCETPLREYAWHGDQFLHYQPERL